jgi:Ca2+-binding EF-hand superfamily protein
MLTELQRAKVTRLFDLLDRDANGRMEADDLYHVAGQLCANRGWAPESDGGRALHGAYEAMWRDVREYANGESVSLEAFIEYHERMLPRPGAFDDSIGQLSGLIFASLDRDGDGRITLAEHRTFCRVFGFDPALADTIFPMWDTDANGFVSTDELAEVVRQFFYATDAEAPGNWLFGPMSSSIDEIRLPRS